MSRCGHRRPRLRPSGLRRLGRPARLRRALERPARRPRGCGSAAARAAMPAVPLVLYGHSMGGLIALGYVLRDPRPLPDLLVLVCPGSTRRSPPGSSRRADPRPDRAAAADPERSAPGSLSRDPAVDERVGDRSALPVELHGSARRRGLRRAGDASRGLSAAGARLPSRPTSFTAATTRSCRSALGRSLERDPNVTRRVYPGLRHETHNEPEGPAVVADTIAWIRASASLTARQQVQAGASFGAQLLSVADPPRRAAGGARARPRSSRTGACRS